jgi:hypothetical protein
MTTPTPHIRHSIPDDAPATMYAAGHRAASELERKDVT